MFIGHFAVGFAAKRFAPRTNLGLLIAAPILLDILWPIFVLLGYERVRIDPGNTRFTPLDFTYYPWSHSLSMAIVWASAFALVYYLVTRYRQGALVIWIGVVSHWILDWISHGRDMPIYPGGPRVGLGLWNSVAGTMVVEIAMFAAAVAWYASFTKARDRVGRYGFFGFVALLFLAYVADRFSAPPSSVGEIVWPGIIAEAVLITWAAWFDRHRGARHVVA
jgi:membrane-bound metal-dependent hydrolase YbcI (DUF457 family)